MKIDFIYVVYEGSLGAMSESGELLRSIGRGDSFSEKFLLQEEPGAASVNCYNIAKYNFVTKNHELMIWTKL